MATKAGRLRQEQEQAARSALEVGSTAAADPQPEPDDPYAELRKQTARLVLLSSELDNLAAARGPFVQLVSALEAVSKLVDAIDDSVVALA
jgi:hypothetical protein